MQRVKINGPFNSSALRLPLFFLTMTLLCELAPDKLFESRAGCVLAAEDITYISPPEARFYSKQIDCLGIPIKSSAVVSDSALHQAKSKLRLMLQDAPDIAWNLQQLGAELHLIGKDQVTSDLPEHRSQKGKPFDGNMDIDQRTRGVGGVCASCGEENLLGLAQDRYADRPGSICVHEFAHTIRNYGLDASIQKQWHDQYTQSIGKGLWRSAYASKNDDEYFAELSMWYFGGRGDYGKITPTPEPGKQWLQRYDPDACRLLDQIYRGQLRPTRIAPFVVAKALPASEESSLRSLNADVKTQLRLVNKTDDTVYIFWLDYQGKRKPYGSIEPNGFQIQNTFVTHPFLFADKLGNALAIFVASKEPAIAVLKR